MLPDVSTPAAQQIIQAILAPVLMISACGLLLLGLNNRYTSVVNRIRLLNDEKRRKLASPDEIDRDYVDMLRFESVMRQIPSLLQRANYLRRALFFLWITVGCALLSSVSLSTDLLIDVHGAVVAVAIFVFGIASAVVGVVFALLDIAVAYRVLTFEIEIY
jgi:hypothetical protein